MLSQYLFALVLTGYLCLDLASGACPHEDSTLQTFSSTKQYTDGLTKMSNITITSGILLDVDIEAHNINITGMSAKLVFDEKDITVKTYGIMVTNNGQLIIGSEDCKFTHNVNIFLKGERNIQEDTHPDALLKYIFVYKNATIQMHGQQKKAWTKLSKTVNRFEDLNNGADVKYNHKTSIHYKQSIKEEGFMSYKFNASIDKLYFTSYDFVKHNSKNEQAEVDRMTADLNNMAVGELVAIMLHKRFKVKSDVNVSNLWTTMETVAGMNSGELYMRSEEERDAFALVFERVPSGSPPNYNQAIDKAISKIITKATASIDYNGWKVSAESVDNIDKLSQASIDLRILSQDAGYPTIYTVGDVSSWNVGDEIALATTDYSYKHTEVRKIKSISGNAIRLSGELFYRHFGEIEDKVDMRAEVALLTRNIKIEGCMSRGCPEVNGNCNTTLYDMHGGHIKIMGDFNAAFIEGVELKHMGKATDKGNYPIHFHMCGNITGKVAVIKENSIHNTFERAITVHGTYGTSVEKPGVKLIRNVAYSILGHAYFLEDGIEVATILEGNLAAEVLSRKSGFTFTTDASSPACFWITNPKTVMEGNVCAGSQGKGIWYTFPLDPVGESVGSQVYQHKEARYTPLWKFDHNIAHSCNMGGMNFDNILEDDEGNIRGCMRYQPLVNPLNTSSDPAKVSLVRLTAYKNLNFNCWLRGGFFELIQYSSAESRRGLQMARASDQQQFIKKSTFIGKSRLNSEEYGVYPDAPSPTDLSHVIGGMLYDGPTHYSNCYFKGFQPAADGSWKAGALGFQKKKLFSSPVTSTVSDMRFGFDDPTGNRAYEDESVADDENLSEFVGEERPTFRDKDGSVSQCASSSAAGPYQIVKANRFFLTPDCQYRKNWQMAICYNLYGKMIVKVAEAFSGHKNDFDDTSEFRRTRFSDANDKEYFEYIGNVGTRLDPHVMVILEKLQHYYCFQFTTGFPKAVEIEAIGVESGLSAIFGICLPQNAVHKVDYSLTVRTSTGDIWRDDDIEFVGSFDELKADTTMKKVYQMGSMLYMHYQNPIVRNNYWDAYDTDHCSGGTCPRFFITLLNDALVYTKCMAISTGDLAAKVDVDVLPQSNCTLAKQDPDADWGAGDTFKVHDGQWGDWGEWSYCCYNANEDPSSKPSKRKRNCDNPPPSTGGANCIGNNEETMPCTLPCPV